MGFSSAGSSDFWIELKNFHRQRIYKMILYAKLCTSNQANTKDNIDNRPTMI